jgi:hypothetical protein
MFTVVSGVTRSFTPVSRFSDPNRRLMALGASFVEIGNLALPAFEEFVRLKLCEAVGSETAQLEGLLDQYRKRPRYWAEDVERYLRIRRQSLMDDTFVIPHELGRARTQAEARSLSRQLILSFGRLLTGWPEIVAATKQMRSGGEPLASPISPRKRR